MRDLSADEQKCNELFIHQTVYLKYIQAFSRALKSPPYNCVLVISRALKSLNINACRVNSNAQNVNYDWAWVEHMENPPSNRFLPTGLLTTHQKYQSLCKILP